ncbi:E3 ubiquitin-protein ligase MSL2 [Macrobrachium rosenbergii]|uniref:E3 ubiquitin-protein ligase MSL2 n=1 Tax=Macrobrachium rosenbergii TaxID=79674 RepID=UPI0034D5CED7
MNATNLYVTTCRLVMHAQPENRDTWLELYKLLPYLRQSLSCTVCGKLLVEPYTPTETTCQHHVCKKCLGGKKRLKPTCSWCKDYDMYVDNAQIKLLLQCYRKLCEYIKFTPIYCKLNPIYNNGGQLSLIEMIDEAVGKTNNNKCEEINSIHCDDYESDTKENILTDISNETISVDDTHKENTLFGNGTNETEVSLPEASEPSKELLLPETSVSEVNIAVSPIIPSHSECKQEVRPPPAPIQTIPTPHVSLVPSSVSLGVVQGPTQPTCTAVPSPVSSSTTGSLSAVKTAVPTQTPILPVQHHHYSSQVIPTTLAALPSGTSGCGFAPGTIFSSTKGLVTHSVVGDMPSYPPKHNNSPVNNGSSSMYSVMYADGDSTKITIKRKPPGMDATAACTNKSIGIPVEPEAAIPDQDLIKKPKPKPKPKPKRKGCRCGNATPTPGKLTCCGQRCPCYVEAKACIECRCRGCRNPHRPGGKKVRPVIPQLANIQIHQVQPVHGRSSSTASMTTTTPTATTTSTANTNLIPTSISSPAIANTSLPQTIRAVQAMHAVQAVHGVNTTVQAMAGGVHQLIALGGGVVQTGPLSPGLGVHPVSGLAMKPVSLALTSVPAQLLINDDRSTSASTSDNSDVDVDI